MMETYRRSGCEPTLTGAVIPLTECGALRRDTFHRPQLANRLSLRAEPLVYHTMSNPATSKGRKRKVPLLTSQLGDQILPFYLELR